MASQWSPFGPPDKAHPPDPRRPVVLSRDLFETKREIAIVHREEADRLRITRTDKLIHSK